MEVKPFKPFLVVHSGNRLYIRYIEELTNVGVTAHFNGNTIICYAIALHID